MQVMIVKNVSFRDTVIGQFTFIGKFSILRYCDKSDTSLVALVQDTHCMKTFVISQ